MALQRLLALDEEEVRAGRRSADTVDFHRTKAGHLVRVFETNEKGEHVAFSLERLRAADVDGYISRRRHEGAADTTISKELVVLRKSLRLRSGRACGAAASRRSSRSRSRRATSRGSGR